MNIKTKLAEKANIFIALLLIIQPILNVISFWFSEWGLPGFITLALRLGILAITVLYSYIVSERKIIYWIAGAVISVVYILHAIACIQVGYSSIVADISNYIRVIQTPLFVICFISLLRENKNSYQGLQFGLTISLLIIFAVMVLATITGTDPHTYTDGKGVLGWFNNTNSQSSNLTLLLPVSLGWQLTWKNRNKTINKILFWTTCIAGLLAMYFFCTRLAYLGIIATTIGIGVVLLIVRRKDWKTSVLLFALALIFIVLIPFSPMVRHMNNGDSWLSKVQGWADDEVQDVEKVEELKEELEEQNIPNEEPIPDEQIELTHRELVELLAPLYEWKVADFVEIFGLEETMEIYNYTTDVNDFADIRAKKITFAEKLLEESPVTARLFGLEITRFTVECKNQTYIYDVENDFHGIYYLYGWVGLISYLAFLAYFVYLIAWALIKNAKKYFTIEAATFGIAFIMCMIHSYCTAGVLRRPDASIFLTALLAAIYYLVRIRQYEEDEII